MADQIVTVLGVAQDVEEIDAPSYVLHDPFFSTTLDFMRRCLDQLSKAMHVVVCHTYNKLPSTEQNSFFLASFSPKKKVNENKKVRQKNFGDPSRHESGRDIQWLLKNIRFHLGFYAEKLTLKSEILDDITLFLLDSIRNQMAHQHYLKKSESEGPGNPWLRKYMLTLDCISAALDLVTAVCIAEYFKDVKNDISKIKRNLERMFTVLNEHKLYSERKKKAETSALNTEKVLSFMQDGPLIEKLKSEITQPNSYKDRPFTHFFQTVIIPRLSAEDTLTQNDMEIDST